MGFPAGMQLATVAFGIPLTVTGKDVVTNVSVKPTSRVIWAATGQPLPEFSDSFTAEAGQLGQFQVPFIDQAGFIDSAGNTVTDFAYQITASWSYGNERPITWAKNLKPMLGQTGPIDLDLVPDGPVSIPVTAPTAAVLGFGGRTGFVTLQESDLPSRLSPESLSATFVPKWKATTAYLAGDKVLNPSGDVVSAIANFTSGASYNAANWNLSPTYGRKRGTFEFYDDYSGYADGAVPATALTGQTNSLYSATDPNGIPIISGGYMTYGSSDYLGGYVSRQLDDSVVRIGASFAFTSWSTGGGLACIAVMEEDIKVTQGLGQGVPRSPFHLTISPEAWGLDVFTTKGSPKTNVGGGVFAAPLVADGVTLHRAEGVIDRENKIVYLTLPDGTRRSFTHASFGIAAKWVFDEPFRDTSGAGKTLAKFRNFWADSRNMAPIPAAKANNTAQALVTPVKSVLVMPTGNNDITLTTTASKIAGTDCTYVVPTSTNVLVTLEAMLDVTTDGPIYFGVFNSSNALVAVASAATKIGNGVVSVSIALTAGTAGANNTISFCVYKSTAAVAKVLLGNYTDGGGANVYARASITVTPL